MKKVLVFGATGALGSAAADELRVHDWHVVAAGRGSHVDLDVATSADDWAARAAKLGTYDAVVWAQGANASGGVLETDSAQMHQLYEANVVYISDTLRLLVETDALSRPCRAVIVSSVWQLTSRSNKLAYVASKAALAGLIPAIASDLAGQSFSINGVLPGVIDTPMTRSQLSSEQIARIEEQTPGGHLALPSDVATAIRWLIDPSTAAINGQWVAVDHGWSAVRSV